MTNQLEFMSISEPESFESQNPVSSPCGGCEDVDLVKTSEETGSCSHSDDAVVHEGNEGGTSAKDVAKEESDKRSSSLRPEYEQFLAHLETLAEVEVKLQAVIDFMESSLAQSGTPHFKSFWDARGLCLELFKQNVNPIVRATLWNKYNELSKEARRLKEILDEQSAFAVEQIEIAIKALEDDLVAFHDHVQNIVVPDLGSVGRSLKHRLSFYQEMQKKLNLLNTQASRINALRKELIRTEMRVRQKNKFFQRLSLAGDKVFPLRKELIKEVSQAFNEDVQAFVRSAFGSQDLPDSLFGLREEIKALQNAAKELTLNTHVFTETRTALSECWDRIRNEEKERKKERSQQKAVFKQNYDSVMEKIKAFAEAQKEQPVTPHGGNKQLDEIVTYAKSLELGRDEQRALREELHALRQPLLDQQRSEEQKRQQQEEEKDRQRRQRISELKAEIQELIRCAADFDFEQLTEKREVIIASIQNSNFSKIDKQELERQLKPLRDLIIEKKESTLLNLSDDDKQVFEQLKEVLQQRKGRRQEIREQMEVFRKAAGASGLDFVRAMEYNELLAAEKERLEKINQGIQEVEKKIADLSNR